MPVLWLFRSDEKRASLLSRHREIRQSRRSLGAATAAAAAAAGAGPPTASQLPPHHHHHHHHHDYMYSPLPPTSAPSAASFYGGEDAASGLGHEVDLDLNSSASSGYRKRFAKSLCSVLLVAAVLLVIFAVLGIVAVAVYLGMLTNDPEFEKYMAQFQGGFNVIGGDRYGQNLSSFESEEFRRKSEFYRSLLSEVFKSSVLGAGFHHVKVEGFRNGTDHFRVFFKVHLDRRKISHAIDDLTKAVHEVISQEVMSLKPIAFKDIAIDIDSILVERIRRRSDELAPPENDPDNGIFQKVIAGPPSSNVLITKKLSSSSSSSILPSERESNDNDLLLDSVLIGSAFPPPLQPPPPALLVPSRSSSSSSASSSSSSPPPRKSVAASGSTRGGGGKIVVQPTTYAPPIIAASGWTPPPSHLESGFHPSLYFPRPPFRGQIPPKTIANRHDDSKVQMIPNRDIPLAVRPLDAVVKPGANYASGFLHDSSGTNKATTATKLLNFRPPNIPVTPQAPSTKVPRPKITGLPQRPLPGSGLRRRPLQQRPQTTTPPPLVEGFFRPQQRPAFHIPYIPTPNNNNNNNNNNFRRRPNMPQNRILDRYGEIQTPTPAEENKVQDILIGTGFSFKSNNDKNNAVSPSTTTINVSVPISNTHKKPSGGMSAGILVVEEVKHEPQLIPIHSSTSPSPQPILPEIEKISPQEPETASEDPVNDDYYYYEYPEEPSEENPVPEEREDEEEPAVTELVELENVYHPEDHREYEDEVPERPNSNDRAKSDKSQEMMMNMQFQQEPVDKEAEEEKQKEGADEIAVDVTKPPVTQSTLSSQANQKISVTYSISSEERDGSVPAPSKKKPGIKPQIPSHLASLPYDPEIIRDLFGVDIASYIKASGQDNPKDGNDSETTTMNLMNLPPQKSYISGTLASPPPPLWKTTPAVILPEPSPTSYSGFRESLRPLPNKEHRRDPEVELDPALDEDWLKFFTTPKSDSGDMKLVTLSKVGGIRYHKRLDEEEQEGIETTTTTLTTATDDETVTETTEQTTTVEISIPGKVTKIYDLSSKVRKPQIPTEIQIEGGNVKVISTVLGVNTRDQKSDNNETSVFVVHSEPLDSEKPSRKVIQISKLPPTVRVVQSGSKDQTTVDESAKQFVNKLGIVQEFHSSKNQRQQKSLLSHFANIRVAADSKLIHSTSSSLPVAPPEGSDSGSSATPSRQLGTVFEKWFGNGFAWPQAIPGLFRDSPKNKTVANQQMMLVTKRPSMELTTGTTLKGYPVKPIVLKENQSITDLLDEIFVNKTTEEVTSATPTLIMEPKEEFTFGFTTGLGTADDNASLASDLVCNEKDHFFCKSGDECVSIHSRCNQMRDCHDYSDEADSDPVTGATAADDTELETQQDEKFTHPQEQFLTNTVHNSDGSTAKPGPQVDNTVVSMVTSVFHASGTADDNASLASDLVCNEKDHFFCKSGDECVSIHSRCNQMRDCHDYSDEADCTCADYLRAQFLTRKICDGVPDCWDFSDEKNCDWCEEQKDGAAMYNCQESQFCVSEDKVCDGKSDCPFGDDESRCVTVSPSLIEADNPTYHSRGFLMVRKSGKWGKLCLNNFENVVRQADTHWDITDLGRAACKALTYQDFELVERRYDAPANGLQQQQALAPTLRTADANLFFQLIFGNSESSEETTEDALLGRSVVRGSLTYTESKCPRKDVLWVQCGSLKCGRRYGASSPKPHGPQARIVGGANSRGGAWPWIAALYKEGVYQCGGTLMSPQWLISAGHCFYHATDQYWVARLGALRRGTSLASPFEQVRHITHIILHPKYEDTGFINDISVLRMERAVELTDFVRPICLPPPDLPVQTGRICTVAGWGQLFEVGRIFPDTLQEVQMPLLSTEDCRKRTVFFPLYRITENMFCAGYERGGRDACLGDSGGPLMCQEDDGRWILAGVTSNGYGCARASRPGVYTKVSQYLSWVRAIMESDNLPKWKTPVCEGHRCPLGDCLLKKNLCNGFMECSDGSDERNCTSSMLQTLETHSIDGQNTTIASAL
ncbi:unnamed protein product [Notodromas monacha]|uniref:Uncharacterized protein n=1 Tax=Notodromas monacha TaxID=399045 RepID=A0A7R9BXS8_9CRUS|nr:unnamed protein product [Notodromas monacha]CAG0922381.1 unnamed protein product [Notodromas monacha]